MCSEVEIKFPLFSISIVLACESHSQDGLAWVYARPDLDLPPAPSTCHDDSNWSLLLLEAENIY